MAIPWLELTGIYTGTPPIEGRPPGKYVYQRTARGNGNVPTDKHRRQQIRIWVHGTDTNTTAQQPYRARFALGVGAWHALTEPEREAWRAPGARLHLNRFQAFMRNWCRTTAPGTQTVWDMGATTWDSGATAWPLPD